MTNERQHSNSAERDERVSRTYGDLAGERAPDHLNQTVLRQAAVAARPAYARSMRWTRPLAWAATITLCLAISLQIARVPTLDSTAINAPGAPADDSPKLLKEQDVVEQIEQRTDALTNDKQPLMAPPGRTTRDAGPDGAMNKRLDTAQKEEPKHITAPGVTDESLFQSSRRSVAAEAEFEPAEDAVPSSLGKAQQAASSAEEFELQDGDMMRRAKELARLQSGNNDAPVAAFPAAAISSDIAAATDTLGCDDEAKALPSTWLACIGELEQAGQDDAARKQREQLSEAFPDFQIP